MSQLDEALAAYRAGDYFEAHEIFEASWQIETDARLRLGRQGLVLVAVAMHKLFAQQKPFIAARLVRRAIDRLERGPSEIDGIAIDTLCGRLAEVAEALERGDTITAPEIAR